MHLNRYVCIFNLIKILLSVGWTTKYLLLRHNISHTARENITRMPRITYRPQVGTQENSEVRHVEFWRYLWRHLYSIFDAMTSSKNYTVFFIRFHGVKFTTTLLYEWSTKTERLVREWELLCKKYMNNVTLYACNTHMVPRKHIFWHIFRSLISL